MPLTPIFALQNPKNQCAAMSQTWLGISMISGQPVLDATLCANQSVMGRQQKSSGKSSAQSLPESGLTIASTNVFNDCAWLLPINHLLSLGPGYYYLTLKAGTFAHAMGAIITSNRLFYLEPQYGLYSLAKNPTTATELAQLYVNSLGAVVREFKIYTLQADEDPDALWTDGKTSGSGGTGPKIGGHRATA